MFTIQYNVFTNLQNPNSNYGIRKPWAKNPNHGLKSVSRNTVENNKKKFSVSTFESPNPHYEYGFDDNPPKMTTGALAGYPHVTSQAPCKEYNTYPTFYHLFFFYIKVETNFSRSTI